MSVHTHLRSICTREYYWQIVIVLCKISLLWMRFCGQRSSIMSFQHLSIPDCPFYSILMLLYKFDTKQSVKMLLPFMDVLKNKIFQHLPMFLFLFLSIRNQTPECVIFVLLKLLLLAISHWSSKNFVKLT